MTTAKNTLDTADNERRRTHTAWHAAEVEVGMVTRLLTLAHDRERTAWTAYQTARDAFMAAQAIVDDEAEATA